jgi:hypothetical protein
MPHGLPLLDPPIGAVSRENTVFLTDFPAGGIDVRGIADLIGQSVWDCHGVWVGQIVDVKMIKAHRGRFGLREGPQIAGLVVSSTRAPLVLGLVRDPEGRLNGSAQVITRILCLGSKIVPWDAIASAEGGEVLLSQPVKAFKRF